MYMTTRANLGYWSTDNCCMKWSLQTGAVTIGVLSLFWQSLMVVIGVMMIVRCPVVPTIDTLDSNDTLSSNLTLDDTTLAIFDTYYSPDTTVIDTTDTPKTDNLYPTDTTIIDTTDTPRTDTSYPPDTTIIDTTDTSKTDTLSTPDTTPVYSATISTKSTTPTTITNTISTSDTTTTTRTTTTTTTNADSHTQSATDHLSQRRVRSIATETEKSRETAESNCTVNSSSNSTVNSTYVNSSYINIINFNCSWLPGPEIEVLGIYDNEKLFLVAAIFICYSGIYTILSMCVIVGAVKASVTLLHGWVALTGFHNLVILGFLLVPLPFTTLPHLLLTIAHFIINLYTWAVVKSYRHKLKVEAKKPLIPEGAITNYSVEGVDVAELPVQV